MKLRDLDSVFGKNTVAWSHYQKYLNERSIGGTQSVIGAALIISSPGLALVALSHIIDGGGEGDYLAGLSLAALVGGIVLVSYGSQSRRPYLEEAIDVYNGTLPAVGSIDYKLQLGTTAHGFGLVYSF